MAIATPSATFLVNSYSRSDHELLTVNHNLQLHCLWERVQGIDTNGYMLFWT